jgi:hypothetical protein
MLGWLFNRIRRKRAERERAVYRYWNGREIRTIDPIEVIRTLMNSPPFDWSKDPIWISSALTHQERDAALQRTVAAVRSAFRLPVTGSLTETECVGLLIAFVAYIREQKKSGNLLLTSLLNTAQEPSPSTSDPIPNSDSDSGSTSNASSIAEPCPS